MSVTKKKIGLVAKEIDFTQNSIIYKVEIPKNIEGVVFCSNDIKDKDLVLQPTYLDPFNDEVIFNTDLGTVPFYENIFAKTLRNLDEYILEASKIYLPGDIVGYVLVEEKRKKKKVDNSNQFNLFNKKGELNK